MSFWASCAFQNEFFRGNQCTLDQLSEWFPWLLLFIVPAITMNVWSEERRRGTDELLFTLPGTDVEILLGKYLAVVVVFTVAILFSLTHVIVLAWLGDPDPYRLFATYVGYWCAGCAVLATGMVASALTSSTAVAFVLGAVFFAVPVGLSLIPGYEEYLLPLTVGHHLDEFARGTIPLTGLFYFGALTLLMLYINHALIARRRWVKAGGMHLGWHYLIRGISLAAVLISFGYMVSATANWSVDMTNEGIYTLADVTQRTLNQIEADDPVTIEAYISNDVGAPYDRVKSELEGILSRIKSIAGSRLNVRYFYLDPLTEDAKKAEDDGIVPRNYIRNDETTTHAVEEELQMGLVVKRGYDRVVIPFIDLGMSIEYEVTRAIGRVIDEERMTIGILATDASVMGGMNMQTFQEQPTWRIVEELRKQYNVVGVQPEELLEYMGVLPSEDGNGETKKLDVLIAVLPSSLSPEQMQMFLMYVRSGHPTLIFDDPMPRFSPSLAPLEPKPSSQGGMMQQAPPEAKADDGRLTSLMSLLQCAWESDGQEPGQDFILMDEFNPHPQLEYLPPAVVFITPRSGVEDAINQSHPVTAGLQEILTWFPGTIRPRRGSDLEFTPLLRSGKLFSGLLDHSEIITRDPFFGSRQIRDNPDFERGSTQRTLSNRVGWTEDRQPATRNTLLNDLDQIIGPFADGDAIVIAGAERRTVDGELVEHEINDEFAVSADTTLDDLIAKLDELYESAEATLSSTGRITLMSILPGETTLELELSNRDNNAGELRFDTNPMEVEAPGSEGVAHVIAAEIRSKDGAADDLNVIFVADIDLVADPLLQVELGQQADLAIDNSRFVMNAIDVLAGDEQYVQLRSRRSGMRTLEAIEAVKKEAHQEFLRLNRQARKDATQRIADFRADLDRRVQEIEEDTSVSVIAKQQMLQTAIEDRAAKYEKQEDEIERETEATIRQLRRDEQRDVRAAERSAWVWAVCVPPLPAAILGLVMFLLGVTRERNSISPDRRLRRAA